jgi:hypothetical protein
MKMFMDNTPAGPLTSYCPFGIHSICEEGLKHNIKPGQWYGPQMISIVLRNICDKMKPIEKFKIHVCLDGTICMDQIEEYIDQGQSVLVMIPTRLGLDSIQ